MIGTHSSEVHVLAVSACIALTAHGGAPAWAMCCGALLAGVWQERPIDYYEIRLLWRSSERCLY